MKKQLILMPLAVALTAGAPQAADAGRVWGAIALSPGAGISYTAVGTERDIAGKQAIRGCVNGKRLLLETDRISKNDYNFFRCELVAEKSTTFACIAVAFAGDPADSWAAGWGFADSYADATTEALSDCQRKGIRSIYGCRVAKVACPG